VFILMVTLNRRERTNFSKSGMAYIDMSPTLAASAASIAVEQAKARPFMAGLTMFQLGLAPVLGAGWLTAPLLQAVGFGPLGPNPGTPSISAGLKSQRNVEANKMSRRKCSFLVPSYLVRSVCSCRKPVFGAAEVGDDTVINRVGLIFQP
jgi:hypothetical protein